MDTNEKSNLISDSCAFVRFVANPSLLSSALSASPRFNCFHRDVKIRKWFLIARGCSFMDNAGEEIDHGPLQHPRVRRAHGAAGTGTGALRDGERPRPRGQPGKSVDLDEDGLDGRVSRP